MSFVPFIRPEVKAFEPYAPGKSIESVREQYGLARVIKLASNENPLGASPVVQRTVRDHASTVFRYPQAGNPELTAAIAAYHNIDPGRVVVGNGSDEIIDLLVRVLVDPSCHEVAAFCPCFGIYSTQSALCGVQLRQTPLNPDFSFPWHELLGAINGSTALVFLTTPDNPSGFCPPVEEVERFARALPPGCLLVVDEAYMDFCDDESAHSLLNRLDEFPNVAVLRTFSKSRGLAGLRLGYGILPAEVADYVKRVRLPFSVNVLVEKAGIAALEDDIFYRETLRVTKKGRDQLASGLRDAGCVVYPSMSNFIMFGLPEASGIDAASLAAGLLGRGVIVRPLAGYGLPHLLRVSVGLEEENTVFLECLCEILVR